MLASIIKLWRAFTAPWRPAPPQEAVAPEAPPTRMKISYEALGYAAVRDGVEATRAAAKETFKMYKPPKWVIPEEYSGKKLAMDSAIEDVYNFASIDAVFSEGLGFLGYPYLAELTQRPEYRRPAEIVAKEMTRKWIRLQSTGDKAGKAERIKELDAELKRLNVRAIFRKALEQDGFFGRSQIYIDVGVDFDNREELKTPLIDSKTKIKKGSLVRFKLIEPIWTYPNFYNAFNPLDPTFFHPQSWFVMGKELHESRVLTFISRQVPDLLKPAYAFGGLSLSQMCKPYVDNWLRTRQSVSDLLHGFSIFVLKTQMGDVLQAGSGEDFFARVALFNKMRDNRGMMVIDKDKEELENVSAPLGGLSDLQAQTQEHMSGVTGIPLIVLFGISPKGLNATSEGELKTFYGWIEAQQEGIRPHLRRVLNVVQLNLWGEIDSEIDFAFEPLWSLSEGEQATARKTDMETDALAIDKGIIDPAEARERMAAEEDSPYASLDLNKVITPPDGGQESENEIGAGLGLDPEESATTEKETP